VDDLALVQDFVNGNRDAFRELVGRHHAAVLSVARYYAGEHCEDVAQETWIAVMRGAANFGARSSFRTWLLTICANRARTMGFKASRQVAVDFSDQPTAERFNDAGMWITPPQPFGDVMGDEEERRALIEAVRAAVADLGDPLGTVVTLRDVEGLTTREVAEILQLSEANVRVMLHRGRAAVRRVVEHVREEYQS
jgi:RNA polymerase sigma-70 factor (ECF subfamily)